ncbi:hypothetical protein M3Y98_01034400 [Aphelenchoides besseyi]|nr:hypothetical protein M3Y98_01034400 [Aphelenchoides besseyi]KAI6209938.1 hypothetical protein M3Y96_00274100 [Aphelenchoides besseyi]
MLQFLVVLDGIEKIQAFAKLITPVCEYNCAKKLIITLREDTMIIFRPADSVRLTNMFQLNIHPSEAFTSYLFEYDTGEDLSFEIKTEELEGLFCQQSDATDKLSIGLKMFGNTPFLSVDVEPQEKNDVVKVEFKEEGGLQPLVTPENVGDSLHVTFSDAETLKNMLNSIRYLECKVVEFVADNRGNVQFKAVGKQARAEIEICDLAFEIKSGDETIEMEDGESMSAIVEVRAFVNFIRIIATSSQHIKVVVIDGIALRVFIERIEGFYTLYLMHNGSDM